MVSDIPVGLAELFGDFFERMPFEEVQSKRFALVLGQRLQDPPPAVPSEEPFDGLIVFCAFVLSVVTIRWFVCDSGQIESLGLQSSPSQEGLGVSHLNYPGTGRTFRVVKQSALFVDI